MRFVIGQAIHETNTFSGMRTTEESFRALEWAFGEQIRTNHEGVRSYIGGMFSEAERLGIETTPVFAAAACPSGIIAQETYDAMKQHLLEGIATAGEYDAVCLALHGAGVADRLEDIEGDLIQAVRQLVGRAVPLVVTLDLHANVTPLMVEHADLIIGNHDYPHVDCYERGQEAVHLAKRIVDGEISPVMRLAKAPLLMPTIATAFHPVDEINRLCREAEQDERVIDCTFYHGFPYADIGEAGVAVLVATDRDSEGALAQRLADEVAGEVMELKEHFVANHPSPEEGIALALDSGLRPVVINETSDNPGAGAPGDGTRLLRALLEQRLEETCLAFIYDPETADAAHRAGIGAHIDLKLGGKSDDCHGSPLELRAYVKSLTDGQFVTSSPMGRGTRVDLGRSARLQVEGVSIIVCSGRNQVFDEQIFLLHGIDVKAMRIVALKSSHHFRAAFEPLSARIVTVDSPGLSMSDFTSFPYANVRRPIFPLDLPSTLSVSSESTEHSPT